MIGSPGVMLFAFAIAVVVVALFADQNRLHILHKSGPQNTAIFYLAIFASAFALAVAGDTLNKVNSIAESAVETAKSKQIVQLEERIERLELANGRTADVSTSERTGPLAGRDVEVRVQDSNGAAIAAVVVHLFPNRGVWAYDTSDIELIGREHFWSVFDRSILATNVVRYDLVVGLGLSSNPTDQSPARLARAEELARERALSLCGRLSVRTSLGNAAGWSLGRYTGPAAQARDQAERSQRTVVLVGITKLRRDLDEQQLLDEVLRTVRIPGVDIRLYENVQPGRSPERFRVVAEGNCDSNP